MNKTYSVQVWVVGPDRPAQEVTFLSVTAGCAQDAAFFAWQVVEEIREEISKVSTEHLVLRTWEE